MQNNLDLASIKRTILILRVLEEDELKIKRKAIFKMKVKKYLYLKMI